MKNVRRLILYLASAVGIWLLVSFGGAMVDSGNAAFWSSSLMWALLTSLIIAPALLMANDVFTRSKRRAGKTRRASQKEQKPFVEDDSDEVRTLWPEPEQKEEWPPQEEFEKHREHARA